MAKLDNNGWPIFDKSKPKSPELGHFYCKLKLDKRTTVFVRDEASYKDWMVKFPKAEKIEI